MVHGVDDTDFQRFDSLEEAYVAIEEAYNKCLGELSPEGVKRFCVEHFPAEGPCYTVSARHKGMERLIPVVAACAVGLLVLGRYVQRR